MKTETILVAAPHTDDAELGCGGAIAKFAEEGAKVHIAVFSSAKDSLPKGMPPDTLTKEFLSAVPALGVLPENVTVFDHQVRRLSDFRQEILDELLQLRSVLSPDLVLLPSGADVHQDHQVVYAEGLRAFKDISILGYELPWNHVTFSAQAFVVLQKHHLELKWEALKHYKTQIQLGRPYFSQDFIESLAKLRGLQVKVEYAEAFEVVRIRL